MHFRATITLLYMPVDYKPVYCSDTAVKDRLRAWVSSIFGAAWFGWWVITLSLASADFHGHRPTVLITPRPLWCLMSADWTPYLHYRFISRRTFCLPKCAHLPRIHPKWQINKASITTSPLGVWGSGESMSLPHTLINLSTGLDWIQSRSSYPRRNFE